MFRLPSLPKEWYNKLQALCQAHQLSQWQVIILGLHCILVVGQLNPEKLEQMASSIREKYQRAPKQE